MSWHVFLGAGGVISHYAAPHLLAQGHQLRWVNRTGRKPESLQVTPHTADLLDAQAVRDAVQGAEVVYLLAGLVYSTKTWQAQWPVIMRHVLGACREQGARLLFFDNVYALGQVNGAMTEATPLNPCSRKGQVRAQLNQMLLNEMETPGGVPVVIARAADFYGPGTATSFLNEMILKPWAQNKKGHFMLTDALPHSYTYTPDAGRAVAQLGTTPEAFGQVWHLPAAGPPLTHAQWAELATRHLGRQVRYGIYSRAMLAMVGWFVGVVRENQEMLYQNAFAYEFSSKKYEQYFSESPTPYDEGLAATLDYYRHKADQ